LKFATFNFSDIVLNLKYLGGIRLVLLNFLVRSFIGALMFNLGVIFNVIYGYSSSVYFPIKRFSVLFHQFSGVLFQFLGMILQSLQFICTRIDRNGIKLGFGLFEFSRISVNFLDDFLT